MRRLGTLALLGAGVLASAGLTGCDQVADTLSGPEPRPAAEAYAAALAAGTPGSVPLAEPAAAAADEAHAGLVAGLEPAFGGVEPRVEVLDVSRSGDVAEVDLGWTWALPAGEWSYESTTSLRLVDDEWRAVWQPGVVEPSLVEGEVLDASTLGASRGDVVGAGGEPIVTERPVVRLGVDRGAVSPKQAVRAAERLAGLADLDVAAYRDRVEAAGERAFVEAIVYRAAEVPGPVARAAGSTAGVVAIADEQPLAPTRDFAAELLGSVGEVTAEMMADQPGVYRMGDRAGLSGLQARYDEELRGSPGMLVRAVDDAPGASGGERELVAMPATDGDDLVLSLDVDLQRTAEQLLAGVGPASALVALRPSTGEVLAAANGPGVGATNVATFGQAAPGSTFKIVTSLALLRSGLTPGSTVRCTPGVVVDGRRFTNYSDYPAADLGPIPLRRAIASSCNTALIAEGGRIDGTDLYDAAATLGLGIDHDLGFPAYFGSVPQPETDTEAAAALIGQGRVLASPMAMAAVVASVQEGATVVPTLVEGYTDEPPEGAAPLTRGEAEALRSMLREVVVSGSGRGLADLPGPAVLAKTGTAEFERDGEVLTHAWMVAAQGDLAVAAYVEVGESGSRTAGPLVEAMLRKR
ncbi:cell division protein FtsI/penicillin-binding protein 2 [Nocardioides salarius]|uniref:Beta-lactamase n=1 Tax=Nocardioides salarius TaxID=374513 RepID=A0ABS2MAV5_9ACTN|nr:penicillin-binding transpeptidase domain-containing protein [Nocardioides salarius]MBM7508333.1 cell division protein FtsI/penicillin-binding protein 2 [Nocardioides salarius]